MNLTEIFRKDAAVEDHSLVDHSWMQNSGLARVDDPILNIDGMRNPNNIKPQLEVEWGFDCGGGDINLDEPAGEVKRNIPEENLGDANAVILFARDQMNRGYRVSQVVASLKKRYPAALLATAKKGLRDMLALDGIVGRVVLDARGYKDCKAAVKAIANSPYKKFIKYVVGCHCGDPHILPMNERGILGSITEDSSGNGFDDFLAGATASAKTASYCRSTMLPIMSSQGDLDRSMLDDTMIEMMNLTPVPEGVIKQIRKSSRSNLAKVASAFRWLDKQADKADETKYSNKVDASEFIVDRSDNEIEMCQIPESDIYVDGTNPDLSTDIDYSGVYLTNFDGMDSIPGVLDEVPVMDSVEEEQIPVELMDERCNQELPMNEPLTIYDSLDVDPNAAGMEVVSPEDGEIDIDFAEHLEPEFQGIDEIEFDKSQDDPGDLIIDMKQDWNP